MSTLKAKFYSRYEISHSDLEGMYDVFKRYYRNTNIKLFKSDLDKKNGAFLVREKETDKIVGFSTILEMKMQINGKKVLGIFSGDTIMEDTYWGKNPLHFQYFFYFLKVMLKNPIRPVYWFLISKGYKTYLILANNFLNYYPCYNKENKHLADISTAYSRYLFPEYYNDKNRIINFGNNYQSLKGGVAEISDEMCEKFPKIAFFYERNPSWSKGTELPCVGKLSWLNILHKLFVRPTQRPWNRVITLLTERRYIRRSVS